jgi:hypothetical protein
MRACQQTASNPVPVREGGIPHNFEAEVRQKCVCMARATSLSYDDLAQKRRNCGNGRNKRRGTVVEKKSKYPSKTLISYNFVR